MKKIIYSSVFLVALSTVASGQTTTESAKGELSNQTSVSKKSNMTNEAGSSVRRGDNIRVSNDVEYIRYEYEDNTVSYMIRGYRAIKDNFTYKSWIEYGNTKETDYLYKSYKRTITFAEEDDETNVDTAANIQIITGSECYRGYMYFVETSYVYLSGHTPVRHKRFLSADGKKCPKISHESDFFID